MKTSARLAQLSIEAKLELIYAILDDLTTELVANYKEVDVEFRCRAKQLVQTSHPED